MLFAKHSPRAIFTRAFKLVSARYAQTSQAGEDGASQRQDMLAQFIALKYPGTNTPWSVHEVMIECGNILTAGSDTTAVLLSAFFYLLLKHPRVYEKLQIEIDGAVAEGRLDGGGATYAQAVKLDYFQACIKETLRVIPSAGINLPRYVPEGGLALGKYAIPQGTSVGVSPFVFQRTRAVFGEDAGVYRPERWLETSDTEKIAMEKSILAARSVSETHLQFSEKFFFCSSEQEHGYAW
jgi:cytochrome P450